MLFRTIRNFTIIVEGSNAQRGFAYSLAGSGAGTTSISFSSTHSGLVAAVKRLVGHNPASPFGASGGATGSSTSAGVSMVFEDPGSTALFMAGANNSSSSFSMDFAGGGLTELTGGVADGRMGVGYAVGENTPAVTLSARATWVAIGIEVKP